MLKALSAAAVLATVLVAPASAAQAGAPSDKMVIDVVSVNGSGCPDNSAAVTVSPDNTAFTVSYSQYTAQVGVGSRDAGKRRLRLWKILKTRSWNPLIRGIAPVFPRSTRSGSPVAGPSTDDRLAGFRLLNRNVAVCRRTGGGRC